MEKKCLFSFPLGEINGFHRQLKIIIEGESVNIVSEYQQISIPINRSLSFAIILLKCMRGLPLQ